MPKPRISIVRSHRRSIALEIERDGTILVKAPHLMPQRFITKFVSQHQDWITKHTQQIATVLSAKEDGELLFVGQKLRLTPGNYSQIIVQEDKLLFPQGLLFRRDR
ncbi:MAG TPA: YgjP-like metallopeptidase domain-containing protein, partial [Patescibacteria group bacterium]|nr:YgjP-like metallopeptidase domain-containing protein [Patescibacteria group bacterium]